MKPRRYFPSRLGQEHGASPLPMVMYGHDALDTAGFFAEVSTISTVVAEDPDELEAVLAEDVVGIFAMDRPDHAGEAARAVARLREVHGRRLSLLGAWSQDVRAEVAAALACGADGVILPDCDAGEMFRYIFDLFRWVGEGGPVPADEAAHVRLLRHHFASSKFWWSEANRLNGLSEPGGSP